MEFEQTTVVPAPIARVWQVLLDPAAMSACVPGVETVDVLDATHFVVTIHVKVAFVSARFKVNVTITESQPPTYLRLVGAGDEAGMASSLRQTCELFLTDRGDGTTEVRGLMHVEVLGRLGTFGSTVMRTKADRMWGEFGRNLADRVP
jgi:carbon monoxide dehydrogenase subunit G